MSASPPARIIPAYAGSTICFPFVKGLHWDHPRIRGEHARPATRCVDYLGSSPHTRGALFRHQHVERRQGIIPAYAGSTSPRTPAGPRAPDHPRIRGEHSSTTGFDGSSGGSSPHTRGAQRSGFRLCGYRRIIPAYAGSTVSCFSLKAERSDHPRIRGEHAYAKNAATAVGGSSPHTRGARSSRVIRRS